MTIFRLISQHIEGLTQHVLLRLIEEWKANLDNNFVKRAVLMDLSKTFDCIPHDLLISKLPACGFEEKTLLYIYSYLRNRKQCKKVNINIYIYMVFILS